MITNKKKITIGLTGGIATGKSTALEAFRKLGCRVIDCDKVAREVVRKGRPALKKIKIRFGPGVLRKDGSLDRAALGGIVFADPSQKKALEWIIHPEVKKKVIRSLNKIRRGIVVVDVPLLFEAGWKALFDKTLVVWAPLNTQVARLLRRNGLARFDAIRRIRCQMPLDSKKKLADAVIDNSRDKSHIRRQAAKLVVKWASTVSRK